MIDDKEEFTLDIHDEFIIVVIRAVETPLGGSLIAQRALFYMSTIFFLVYFITDNLHSRVFFDYTQQLPLRRLIVVRHSRPCLVFCLLVCLRVMAINQ